MPRQIIVTDKGHTQIVPTGPVGPPGATGPQGPQGPAGAGGGRVGFQFLVPFVEEINAVNYDVFTIPDNGIATYVINVDAVAGSPGGILFRFEEVPDADTIVEFNVVIFGGVDSYNFFIEQPEPLGINPVDRLLWSLVSGGVAMCTFLVMPSEFGAPVDIWQARPVQINHPRSGGEYYTAVATAGDGVTDPDVEADASKVGSTASALTVDALDGSFLNLMLNANASFSPIRLKILNAGSLQQLRVSMMGVLGLEWTTNLPPSDLSSHIRQGELFAWLTPADDEGFGQNWTLTPIQTAAGERDMVEPTSMQVETGINGTVNLNANNIMAKVINIPDAATCTLHFANPGKGKFYRYRILLTLAGGASSCTVANDQSWTIGGADFHPTPAQSKEIEVVVRGQGEAGVGDPSSIVAYTLD